MGKVKGSELNLGDIVKVWDNSDPYSFATVKQIEKDTVTLFRPYVATADFSCTGGVICYVGIEEFKAWKSQEFELVKRGPKLK